MSINDEISAQKLSDEQKPPRGIHKWRKVWNPSVPLSDIVKAAGRSLALTNRAVSDPAGMSDRFLLRLSSGLPEFRECYSTLRQIEDGLLRDPASNAADKAQ